MQSVDVNLELFIYLHGLVIGVRIRIRTTGSTTLTCSVSDPDSMGQWIRACQKAPKKENFQKFHI
jgi:hypothetical protein